MKISFYGSSLLSSYWNGAATYYRGLLRDLAERGHQITFYEPDAYDRQQHRDIDPPNWAKVVVYPATPDALQGVIEEAGGAEVVVKASGVGVFDDELLLGVTGAARPDATTIFWDVDAPATLGELAANSAHPLHSVLQRLDIVFTYGGGDPVVARYASFGARRCVPIYNALDQRTHHPAPPEARFACDLAFLGNRLPDREARVESFFLAPAASNPDLAFLIGGSGWETKAMPANVRHIGHVYTADHNAFNTTPRAVLNIARDSMASNGFSPATRVFEAAGAGACIITDFWDGIDTFFEPEREILVAHDGDEVARIMAELTPERAHAIGQAALVRVLRDHTYAQRGAEVDRLLQDLARNRGGDSRRLRVA